jgi:hypothetical protein
MTRSVPWLRAAAVAGIVASLAQNAWLLESVVATRYDILTSYVSDLGAKTEPRWWFWTTADEIAGVLTVVFAVAVVPLFRELERRARWAVLGAVAFLLSGIGTVADGLLRLPCPESLSAACEARIAAGDAGWVYTAHQVESTFTAVVSALAVVSLAWGLLGDRRWHGAGRWMWYLMPPFAALNVLAGIDAAADIGWPGLWDRLLQLSTGLSMLPPMLLLWRLAPSYAAEAASADSSVGGNRSSTQAASSGRRRYGSPPTST